jgi:hypothetical protein
MSANPQDDAPHRCLTAGPNYAARRYTVNVNRIAKFLSLAALVAITVSAYSVTLPGKWVGKLDAKFAVPAGVKQQPTPEQLKAINESLAGIRVTLTIKVDGTYTAVTTYTTQGPKPPNQTSKGKWKLKGKTVTLLPGDKRPPEVGTISADGKTLIVPLPKDMAAKGVSGAAVFKKS